MPVTTTLGADVTRSSSGTSDAVDVCGIADDHAAVRAAEAERVRHRDTNARPARRADDEVQVAVDIALGEVRIDGHFAAMDGERAHGDLDGAGSAIRCPMVLLVELTLARMTSSPNTTRVAAVSLRSFMPVDVPCAFR